MANTVMSDSKLQMPFTTERREVVYIMTNAVMSKLANYRYHIH